MHVSNRFSQRFSGLGFREQAFGVIRRLLQKTICRRSEHSWDFKVHVVFVGGLEHIFRSLMHWTQDWNLTIYLVAEAAQFRGVQILVPGPN